MNTRASNLETRLKAQYAALDTKMASLTALNSYVSQQSDYLEQIHQLSCVKRKRWHWRPSYCAGSYKSIAGGKPRHF